MIKSNGIYEDCMNILNSMSDDELDEFMKQARIDSRSSYLLGDLDEDELEDTKYEFTVIKSVSTDKSYGWAKGTWNSLVLNSPNANCVYMDGGWAA